MFGWNDSYAIGVSQIDAQHRQLFEIINELHMAMMSRQSSQILGQTLSKLVEYTVKHFGAEEALLRSKSYSELAQHKLIHDQFTARIKKFQADQKDGVVTVNIELMNMLQKWLVDHIQGTDKKYARELKLVS